MKQVTCGIIIYSPINDRYLVGHSTGNKHYDIPKGVYDDSDSDHLTTAVRECYEEFGLKINPKNISDIGLFYYNSKKNIHLFKTHLNITDDVFSKLKCHSSFTHFSGKELPEIDFYKLVTKNEFLTIIPKSLKQCIINHHINL